MKSFPRTPNGLIAITLFLFTVGPTQMHATTLTFDIAGISDAQAAPQAYGDNVTSTTMGGFSYGAAEGFTPNVSVAYAGSPTLWTNGFGDLTNVLYEDVDNTGVLTLTLSADAGYQVRLHSFDLGAYTSSFGADPGIDSVKVFDSANVAVFEQSRVIVPLGRHAPIEFRAPLSDSSLRIEIDARNLGNLNDDIGIDNISFSQFTNVPEPSSLALAELVTLGSVMSPRRGRQGRRLRRCRNWLAIGARRSDDRTHQIWGETDDRA